MWRRHADQVRCGNEEMEPAVTNPEHQTRWFPILVVQKTTASSTFSQLWRMDPHQLCQNQSTLLITFPLDIPDVNMYLSIDSTTTFELGGSVMYLNFIVSCVSTYCHPSLHYLHFYLVLDKLLQDPTVNLT